MKPFQRIKRWWFKPTTLAFMQGTGSILDIAAVGTPIPEVKGLPKNFTSTSIPKVSK